MNSLFIQSIRIDWNKIEENSYLKEIHSIKELNELKFTSPITFLVGDNGTGKSTLLEAIAIAYGFNPEGGTLNYRFSTHEDHSNLADAVQIVKGYVRSQCSYFFRAETFFNLATKSIDYLSSYGGKELHDRSHGESFLAFFQEYDGKGIYLMDEPEAALSPQRQLTLLIQIARMAKEGSQFIIATHSPILLGIPDATILSFDSDKITECSYEETESYLVTKSFINNREQFLKRLLEEE